ncbi:hypothetical protein CU024_0723 [Enterococcus faecium]|nr:hypothetical protein [Enterococcus faecium]
MGEFFCILNQRSFQTLGENINSFIFSFFGYMCVSIHNSN